MRVEGGGRRPKAPCVVCGRVVAVRYWLQATPRLRAEAAGKARVRHNCPHGVVCVNGSTNPTGEGLNGPTASRCPKCRAEADYNGSGNLRT